MADIRKPFADFGIELVNVTPRPGAGQLVVPITMTINTLPARRHIKALERALLAGDPDAAAAALEAMPQGLRRMATAHVQTLSRTPEEGG